MHDPISFDALGRLAAVEDQRFLHADFLSAVSRHNRLVSAGGFPVSRRSRAIRPLAVGVLSLSRAEEVPLLLAETRLT